MIYFLIIILDLLIKLIFNKLIFLALIASLIYFLHNKSQFLFLYFFSSIINDWLLILPLGFTGFYFGLLLIFVKIFNKFLIFKKEITIYLISFFVLALFLLLIWHIYFKINLNFQFFNLLIINFIIFVIFNFWYQNY